MENASKALLMIASILITILIIGLLVFTFKKIKQNKDEDRDSILIEQVTQFNKRFTAYEKEIRGNELYSLINRMIDYNDVLDDYKGTNKQNAHDKMDIEIKINNRNKLFHFNNVFTQPTYNLKFFEEKRFNIGKGPMTLREAVESIEDDAILGGQNKLQALVSEYDTTGNLSGTGFQSPDMEEQFTQKLRDLRI